MIAFCISFKIKFLYLRVFGNIDQYRPRPAAFGNVKCFGNNLGDLGSICYLVVPFGNRGGDVDHICFLEGIGTQKVREHLPGDTTSGVLSICASAKPVTKLVAPGPLVANTTPTLPDVRA
jgi:hypothetical protein